MELTEWERDIIAAGQRHEHGHSILCGFPYRDCIAGCRTADREWRGGKFTCELAYRLWILSLESCQDDDYGSADGPGWFGLFRPERAILSADSYGFVAVSVLASAEDLERTWSMVGHVDYPHESGTLHGCMGCEWEWDESE